MYTSSILMLLSWPAIILLAYFAARYVLYLYEKKQGRQDV
jgi:hypothetical protein